MDSLPRILFFIATLSTSALAAQPTYEKWGAEFESALSTWVHERLSTNPPYPDGSPTPTPPPSNPGTIGLAWDASVTPPAVSGYNLYYGRNAGRWDDFVKLGAVTNYTLTGLTSGTRYYFMVRAYNPNGESLDSNQTNAVAP